MSEIKPEIKQVLDTWYKNVEYNIIQVWEQDDTWFMAIRHRPKQLLHPDHPDISLDFVRIFRIKNKYRISVDKTVGI